MNTSTLSTPAPEVAVSNTLHPSGKRAKLQATHRGWVALLVGALLVLALPGIAMAGLSQRSSEDTRGDIVLVGNALMTHCDTASPPVCGGTGYSDNNTQMQYINTAPVPGATYANSSTADLALPGTATVLHAYLYWGGRAGNTDTNRQNIKLKLPGGSYQTVTALSVNTFNSQGDTDNDRPYDAVADITTLVQGATGGAGTYSVGNLDTLVGDTNSGLGYYGGWAMVVVYSDPNKPFRRLSVYDADDVQISSGNPASVTVTGLLTPTSGTFNAYMGALVWEGDNSLSGDAFQLLDPSSGNVVNPGSLSDALSPATNFWNGGITYLGADVTTRNPGYANALGLDLKMTDVSNTGSGSKPQLANNATTVKLNFTTNQDVYFPQTLVFVTDERPAQTLVKSCPTHSDSDSNTAISLGDTLHCTITLTNTGNVAFAANSVTITDTRAGFTPTSGDANPKTCTSSIPVNGTCVLHGDFIVNQADVDAGQAVNNGTATSPVCPANSTDDFCKTSVSVPVPQLPTILLTKSNNATGNEVAGSTFQYSFSVKNTGNVTLTAVSVSDPMLGGSPIACSPSTLAPNATATCGPVTYTVTQPNVDAGKIINMATAKGKPPIGSNIFDDDTNTVTLTQTPAITIVKSDNATGSTGKGDTIIYSFKVTNTGNVTLNPVTVTDPLSGLSAITCPVSVLAPAATMTCTATYVVKQSDVDAGAINNTATAHGKPPTGSDVTSTDTDTVTFTPAPAITIVKSDNATASTGAGDSITYSFKVTNTGNVTLNPVTVTDPLSGLSAISCPVSVLAPAATTTCTATYTVKQSDVNAGAINNTATAHGKPPTGSDVTSTDTDTVTFTPAPAITIVKSDNSTA
ncbi:MAG TPA: hypothetical protein VFN13_02395 [Rudaea sp.]|nr:hypothetical protein [Rudaea sp.]